MHARTYLYVILPFFASSTAAFMPFSSTIVPSFGFGINPCVETIGAADSTRHNRAYTRTYVHIHPSDSMFFCLNDAPSWTHTTQCQSSQPRYGSRVICTFGPSCRAAALSFGRKLGVQKQTCTTQSKHTCVNKMSNEHIHICMYRYTQNHTSVGLLGTTHYAGTEFNQYIERQYTLLLVSHSKTLCLSLSLCMYVRMSLFPLVQYSPTTTVSLSIRRTFAADAIYVAINTRDTYI